MDLAMAMAVVQLNVALIPPDPGRQRRLVRKLEELEVQLQKLDALLAQQPLVAANASPYLRTGLEELRHRVIISKRPNSRRMSPHDRNANGRSITTGNQCLVPPPRLRAMNAAAPHPSLHGPGWLRPRRLPPWYMEEDLTPVDLKGTTFSPGLGRCLAKKALSTSQMSTLDERSSHVGDFRNVEMLSLQDNHHHSRGGPQPTRSPKWIDAFTLSSVDLPTSSSSESTENIQHDPPSLEKPQARSDNTLIESSTSAVRSISTFLFWVFHNFSESRRPDSLHLL